MDVQLFDRLLSFFLVHDHLIVFTNSIILMEPQETGEDMLPQVRGDRLANVGADLPILVS